MGGGSGITLTRPSTIPRTPYNETKLDALAKADQRRELEFQTTLGVISPSSSKNRAPSLGSAKDDLSVAGLKGATTLKTDGISVQTDESILSDQVRFEELILTDIELNDVVIKIDEVEIDLGDGVIELEDVDIDIGGVSVRIDEIDIDIDHVHVHHDGCGHSFFDGFWHDWFSHHVHGFGCGHHYFGGSWHSFSSHHVHGIGCGHFLDAGLWISFGGLHHRHHAGCGHFFWGGLWHGYSSYHVHGYGCGHHYYDSYWHGFPQSHHHSATCGHYYDGLRWYVYGRGNHVHGAGCGHHYYAGVWNSYPRTYYERDRSGGFYFFGSLGSYGERNVPDYVVDIQTRYETEPVDIFDADDHLSQAYAFFVEKSYYRSITEFDGAIAENPGDGLLYFGRALAHVAISDYWSAYDNIIEGMELIPDWPDVRLNMMELYGDPDEFSAQFEALQSWLERHPTDSRAHFVLGYIAFFLQEFELARSELVYTLAYWPDHAQAQRLIEEIFELQAEAELNEP